MPRLVSFVLLLLASTTLVFAQQIFSGSAIRLREKLPRLKVVNGTFVDDNGRVVLLRGVNMASKDPKYPLISAPSQLDNLSRWGLNLVRLGFNWEAYETNQGEYNAEYLKHFVWVVEEIGKRKMYVLVDFHQDAFSRWAVGGCGEGFPEWTVPEKFKHTPVDQTNPAAIRKAGCTNWGPKQLRDPDVGKLFNRLYDKNSDVGKGFLKMITHVAKAVKKFPHVVGFDVLNEPTFTWRENSKLFPFYEEAGKTLRKVIPSTVLFIEPQMVVNTGLVPTFLKKPSGGNVVYAPHFYDGFAFITKGYYLPVAGFQMGFQYRQAKKWASPYFLGEFGMSPSHPGSRKYIDDIYSKLDQWWASGAQWGYTPFWNVDTKDNWNLEDFSIVAKDNEVRTTFNPHRPYVRYVSGTPIRAKIDTKKKTVSVTWTSGETPKGETEIFVPKEFFGEGFEGLFETSPDLECEYRANLFLSNVEDRVVCTVKATSQNVSLTMRPKKV